MPFGARALPARRCRAGRTPSGHCPAGTQRASRRQPRESAHTDAKLEDAAPAHPTAGTGHGRPPKLYVTLAESDKASEHAQKVVELEPDDTFSYTALSVIYQRCGKIPEAEEAKAKAYYKQMGME